MCSTTDDITVVSAFFDLSILGTTSKRESSHYLSLSESVLKHPYKLVIFLDPKHIEAVTNIRTKYHTMDRTFIIPMTAKDFDTYPLLDTFVKNRLNHKVESGPFMYLNGYY